MRKILFYWNVKRRILNFKTQERPRPRPAFLTLMSCRRLNWLTSFAATISSISSELRNVRRIKQTEETVVWRLEYCDEFYTAFKWTKYDNVYAKEYSLVLYSIQNVFYKFETNIWWINYVNCLLLCAFNHIENVQLLVRLLGFHARWCCTLHVRSTGRWRLGACYLQKSLWTKSATRGNGNSLFMHFCESDHEVTQMQQEEKEQHRRA